ncbi:hypothetical protein DINM_001570 [Dirofilaria immitis]|nr:hypothetical protein [Dirofilaria immitis]
MAVMVVEYKEKWSEDTCSATQTVNLEGGVYKRMVGEVKGSLRKALNTMLLSNGELILTQTESNSSVQKQEIVAIKDSFGVTIWNTYNRMHVGDRMFKYTMCGRDFSQRSNLKTYYWLHTGEKTFECNNDLSKIGNFKAIRDLINVGGVRSEEASMNGLLLLL